MITTEKPLIAFHGDEKIKEKYLNRLKKHYKLDEIIQGTGWENGKGCAVGCTLEKYEHSAYEQELGIPEELARLEDRIFEGLPNDKAKDFPLDFLSAINTGADLSKVAIKFKIWLLIDEKSGVINNIQEDKPYTDECISAINQVAEHLNNILYDKYDTELASDAAEAAARTASYAAAEAAAEAAESSSSESAYLAARSTAEAAAEAARSTASSAAISAAISARTAANSAWTAAKAAISAANSTAWTAEAAAKAVCSANSKVWSAGDAAARSAYTKMKDKLLELLSMAKQKVVLIRDLPTRTLS